MVVYHIVRGDYLIDVALDSTKCIQRIRFFPIEDDDTIGDCRLEYSGENIPLELLFVMHLLVEAAENTI